MSVAFTRAGAGTPIVLVHGLGSHRGVWTPLIEALATTHDVIAVDLPGFGATPPARNFTPSPAAYADWLATWLASIGVERPHVVGNSMGGGICLEMARNGDASRVTVFSPIGFWSTAGRMWCQWLVTMLRIAGTLGGRHLSRALTFTAVRAAAGAAVYGHPARTPVATVRADLAALVGARAFVQARNSFDPYRFTDGDHLSGIPVTIAWGTRDVLLTYRTQSRRARKQLPQARHLDLPGAGHAPFTDDPVACLQAIALKPQSR